MLSELDETLNHQTADTFDHAFTSDHRFFDRYWFGLYDPCGKSGLITGMGTYKNTNVIDYFHTVQHLGKQHNVRLSRSLRPDLSSQRVGPLNHIVEDPFTTIRILLTESDLPISCDIQWNALTPPIEEDHHFSRRDGRARVNYYRYDQVGVADGRIRVDDVDIDVRSPTALITAG